LMGAVFLAWLDQAKRLEIREFRPMREWRKFSLEERVSDGILLKGLF
ncbi:uncharacterized protein METZ01_LOCUS79702, partial [marine metagenome]